MTLFTTQARETNSFADRLRTEGILKKLLPILDLNKSKASDKQFLLFYVQQSLGSVRMSLLLALVLCSLFGILDLYAAPISANRILFIRFAVIVPMLCIAFGLTRLEIFPRMSQAVLIIVSLTVGLSVVAIIYFTKAVEPAHNLYYGGLILTMIWTHTILRLHSTLACISSGIIVIAYNVVMIFCSSFTRGDVLILVTNDSFLAATLILGAYSSIATERVFYSNFRQRRIIEHEKEKLVNSEARLAELNLLKSKLISIMSHDVRGPLSSVKGILNLFSRGLVTQAEFREHAANLGLAIDGTIMLLDNLLSWTVMQIQKNQIIKRKVEIKTIVSRVLDAVRPAADRKGIRLVNDVYPDFEIEIEPMMIELVIRNLVTNAIKFTDHGTVRASLVVFERSVQIIVEDTGVGIASDMQSRLFNWQDRRSASGTHAEKGFGIGLLICKEFVERHGGVMEFSSEEGKGTKFFINLPLEGVIILNDGERVGSRNPLVLHDELNR